MRFDMTLALIVGKFNQEKAGYAELLDMKKRSDLTKIDLRINQMYKSYEGRLNKCTANLQSWNSSHVVSKESIPCFNDSSIDANKREATVNKSKIAHAVSKIMKVVSLMLTGVGLTGGLMFTYASPIFGTIPLPGMVAFLGAALLGMITFAAAEQLENLQIHREARLISGDEDSENFKAFLKENRIDMNQFTKKDLLDPKLHNIYLTHANVVNNLPIRK
jgi:hypothetical protein